MRINVFKERESGPGVRVMELVWVDLALSELRRLEIGSPGLLSVPGIKWSGGETESWFFTKAALDALSLVDDAGNKHQIDSGIIFYHSFGELVDFLMRRIDPDGAGSLSAIARPGLDFNGQVSRTTLEEELTGTRPYRHRRMTNKTEDYPVYRINEDNYSDFVLLDSDQGQVWGCKLTNSFKENMFLALDDKRPLGKHQVPYYQMIKPIKGLDPDPDELSDMDFLIYDGTRHSWARALDEVSPGLLEDMDRKGRMHWQSDFDILPMEHLCPYAVVRVPPRNEFIEGAAEFGQSALRPGAPPHNALAAPGLAFDSHYPIPLPEDIEVLDAPRDALWFLARTVRGIYVPKRNPVMFPAKNVPEHESFQVLARPRRLLP